MPPCGATGKEDSMSGRTLVLVIAVTAVSLAAMAARHDRSRAVETTRDLTGTGTATVEVESLRVISYLDENGTWRSPDSTLVPPVPLRGPKEIAIVPVRAPGQVAERVGPR
jgi:hypothetical protein